MCKKHYPAGLIFLSVILIMLIFVPALFAQVNASDLAELFPWREVGPANPGGRITDIEGVESNPTTIYVGAATGGLWKTVNNGITWDPIFDDQPVGSIGDIAVSLSNPNIIFVGTGEPNNRNSSPWGAGVFKSTDAGETWEFVGLKDTEHIGRILIHPKNPNTVYVAALGKLWGTNEERGLFKTTNGGSSWDKVLYLDERTGVTDITMDMNDPDIIYAAAHERLRDRFDAGDPVDQYGPHAGIYVTRNGGKDWTRCTEGLPTEEMGRIGISASRSKSGTVYALVSTTLGMARSQRGQQQPAEEPLNPNRDGIFKTTDYGKTWKKVNDWHNRPSYYSQVRVDPNNEDVVWFLGSPMAYTSNGGTEVISGRPVQGSTHIDYHACWIDPTNSDHVLVGGDGGINITYDSGDNWEMIKSIGLAQFYAITADMRKPYYLAGGLQDNGVWVGSSRGRMMSGVTNNDWFPLSNADGFFCQIDPTDYTIVYSETQGGSINRKDLKTWQSTGIRPSARNIVNYEDYYPSSSTPQAGQRGGGGFRFDWNSPMQLSSHNHTTLYFGGNHLFKSVNRGDNWKIISPDLTAFPDNRNSAIVSIDESPLVPGVIWAGTNDGNVYMTRNEGVNWTRLNTNMRGAPLNYWVKRVEASNHELGRAYVVFDGHRHDDKEPYIFMTDDFGSTWTRISSNLPEGSVYVVREDYHNPDLLFAGTEFSVFFSIDRGASWQKFMNGFPTVPVHDLLIHPRDGDLIAGTHGRGAWIADNITPLQQLTSEVKEEAVHLFAVRPEVQWRRTYQWTWVPDSRFIKANPPTGSTISYYLKNPVSDTPKLEILDVNGAVIWTREGSNEAGIHKIFWNFSRMSPQASGNQQGQGGSRMRGGGSAGPGEYLVRLTVGN
ncbi:WD40/YVTN/BNR-like repeat-containing protein, partial [candidate division KSB1 bacterium]